MGIFPPDIEELIALSNNDISNPDNHAASNGSGTSHRREARTPMTGALPFVSNIERYAGSFDFDQMIQSLHDLFEHDRQVASQPDSTRCGICYLYFQVDELYYREEGLYICPSCEKALGNQQMPVLRKQQKM